METVNPFELPARPMTRPELQFWILFGMAVAGKGAKVTENKMVSFIADEGRPLLPPFGVVKLYVERGQLVRKLKKHKLGKYTLLNKGFRAALDLDLDNLSIEKLEAVPGIGSKTARMILMYALPNQDFAVLDTHILKWLKAQGYDVPAATPDGKKYLEIEKIVLREAHARKMDARTFDTWIWKQYAKA